MSMKFFDNYANELNSNILELTTKSNLNINY